MKGYVDLLPSYLKDGVNIGRHGLLLDKQDNNVRSMIDIVKGSFILERPLLIERYQEEGGYATITLHFNTESPVKRVYTELLPVNIDESYEEEDLVTSGELSIECTDTIPPVMPTFIAVVETYDGLTYVRGYPENDITKSNVYDHDTVLDNIGALLGIPRRIYKELAYGQEEKDYKNTYPKYFTKQMYSSHKEGDLLTEDDYYYAQRLKKFIREYTKKPLSALMAELLYEMDDVDIYQLRNRVTSRTEDNADYMNAIGSLIVSNTQKYINIDYSNMDEILQRYSNITQKLFTTTRKATEFSVDDIFLQGNQQNWTNLLYLLADENDKGIYNAPIRIKGNNIDCIVYTDSEDAEELQGMPLLCLPGLPPRVNTSLTVQYEGEYEFSNSEQYTVTVNPTEDYDLYFEDDPSFTRWRYNKYILSSATLVAPRMVNDLLSVGKGSITYTPGILYPLIGENTVELYIDFRVGGNYTQLGLTTITKNDEGVNWNAKLTIKPVDLLPSSELNYDILHTLKYHIEDGVISIFLDDVFVKQQNVSSDIKMLYVAGYNGSSENDSNLKGLYFENISLEYV